MQPDPERGAKSPYLGKAYGQRAPQSGLGPEEFSDQPQPQLGQSLLSATTPAQFIAQQFGVSVEDNLPQRIEKRSL